MSSTGQTITIAAPAGSAEAYLTGEPGRPGLVFFVDAIGLRPQIEAMADRMASWGYTVLVPHVFYRDGTAAELAPKGDLREAGAREAFFGSGVMDRVRSLTPDLSSADNESWLATLRSHCAPGPIGTTGYCMGVRLAIRLAGQFPADVAAVGGFHGGGLVVDDDPTSPHLAIAGSRASYSFGHADQDRSMPPEAVTALGATLDAAGRPAVSDVFAGAPHGYSMADTSSYDPEAAERHFTALRSLLDATLPRSAA
jgi:carboxymethylenebutenolidase